MIPPEQYIQRLKQFYLKFGGVRPKSLKELKRLALMEAKKASLALMKITKEARLEILLSKELVITILQSTFEFVNSLFIKINHNFKNERRSVYHDNKQYMDVIKEFEVKKLKLFRYSIKNFCKNSKISFDSLQRSVFMYLERNDIEIVNLVNSADKLGKHFAIAPQSITINEVIEILQKYYLHLNFILTNSKGTDISKYGLIIVNDIIYENFGLEEEQIFSLIEERTEFKDDPEIKKQLLLIKSLVTDNLSTLFEL